MNPLAKCFQAHMCCFVCSKQPIVHTSCYLISVFLSLVFFLLGCLSSLAFSASGGHGSDAKKVAKKWVLWAQHSLGLQVFFSLSAKFLMCWTNISAVISTGIEFASKRTLKFHLFLEYILDLLHICGTRRLRQIELWFFFLVTAI